MNGGWSLVGRVARTHVPKTILYPVFLSLMAVFVAAVGLYGIARGEGPNGQWADSKFIDAKHCSVWVVWRGHQIYQGQGGRTINNDGMEIWVAGRPERKNRQLGYVIYYLPYGSTLKGHENCLDESHDADAVEVAKAVGGDAVIPLGRTGNMLQLSTLTKT